MPAPARGRMVAMRLTPEGDEMFNSHKSRTMIAVVAALASLAMTATADAKPRRYSAHSVSPPLATADGSPGVGGSAYLSGMVNSSRFGDGALVDHVTIIGRPFDQN